MGGGEPGLSPAPLRHGAGEPGSFRGPRRPAGERGGVVAAASGAGTVERPGGGRADERPRCRRGPGGGHPARGGVRDPAALRAGYPARSRRRRARSPVAGRAGRGGPRARGRRPPCHLGVSGARGANGLEAADPGAANPALDPGRNRSYRVGSVRRGRDSSPTSPSPGCARRHSGGAGRHRRPRFGPDARGARSTPLGARGRAQHPAPGRDWYPREPPAHGTPRGDQTDRTGRRRSGAPARGGVCRRGVGRACGHRHADRRRGARPAHRRRAPGRLRAPHIGGGRRARNRPDRAARLVRRVRRHCRR